MKPALLDLNVLIALLWPAHQHHAVAMRWFASHPTRRWATTALTQAGFVRIVSNPAFSPDAVTPAQATAVLQANLRSERHRFWPDDLGYPEAVEAFGRRVVGHRLVTDAYLLGLARHHGGVLASFDAGLVELAGAGFAGVIERIESPEKNLKC